MSIVICCSQFERSASCPNSQRVRAVHPLRIEDNPHSACRPVRRGSNAAINRIKAVIHRSGAVKNRIRWVNHRIKELANRMNGLIYRAGAVKNQMEAVNSQMKGLKNRMKALIYRVKGVKNRMKVIVHPFHPVWLPASGQNHPF